MLFDSLDLRGLTLKNRVVVSPMCQYSSEDGFAGDWHLVHLGQFATGGASLVFTEATAVTPEGRITPWDLGFWKEEHAEMLGRIARFVAGQGAVPAMQLAHAGRKGSTAKPWEGGGPIDAYPVVAPSPLPFSPKHQTPQALDEAGIDRVVRAFGESAERAARAGFRLLEIHAAHGYLLHEFLSPLSNKRTDRYGGSLENRIRIVREVVRSVRSRIPDSMPLFLRISATDWTEGGWTPDDSVQLARAVGPEGVDLVDCSSGGNVVGARIPAGAGYQTPFAEHVRREAGVKTGAVGMIRSAFQADHILRSGQADVVILAREMLRNPHFALQAAKELGVKVKWPVQYERASE